MSEQITYERMMALFMETKERADRNIRAIGKLRREIKETRESIKETDRISRRIGKQVGKLTGSMGKVIEHMVAGDNIIKQFQDLGYIIDSYSRNKTFGRDLSKDMRGEIDLFLENGDIAILIEVKTTLETADVRTHIERLEKFRRIADIKGDKRRFVGAVAGAVIDGDAMDVAHENGLYVIVQSGRAVEIVPVPEGFQARKW